MVISQRWYHFGQRWTFVSRYWVQKHFGAEFGKKLMILDFYNELEISDSVTNNSTDINIPSEPTIFIITKFKS